MFNQAAFRVNGLIEAEIASGIPANRIILAGFSQGGALTLHSAMHSHHKVFKSPGLDTVRKVRYSMEVDLDNF